MMITLMDAAAKVAVTLDLEFGPNQWWIAGATPADWKRASRPKSGHFSPGAAGSRTILLRDGAASGHPFLSLSNMRRPYESKSVSAGSGTFLSSGQPTDERVMWSRKSAATLSPIRRKILQYLKDKIPKAGLYSNHKNFKEITGFDTASLQDFWKGNSGFTTCNSFAGGVAQRIGTPSGRLLNQGLLQLDRLGKEVPGSWIPAKPNRYPRPGDYYSRPSKKYKRQLMGHVGIVMSVDNQFISIDGGQDNSPLYGLAKWTEHGPVENFNFTGWIDLEVYFYGTPVWRKRITGR
jgi:hypothetical protein